ncbi:MAG: hypothetical protein QOJ51_975, partial [Acidobacteriaceae bacterium]|nr:hypothetical protein [Acidobacteriaceae bacterium]
MKNGWVGFHAEPVAGIPGLKSETWGTLRFLPTLRWIRKETADPSASLRRKTFPRRGIHTEISPLR